MWQTKLQKLEIWKVLCRASDFWAIWLMVVYHCWATRPFLPIIWHSVTLSPDAPDAGISRCIPNTSSPLSVPTSYSYYIIEHFFLESKLFRKAIVANTIEYPVCTREIVLPKLCNGYKAFVIFIHSWLKFWHLKVHFLRNWAKNC